MSAKAASFPSFVNPMMTLCAVGATSADERPSGETTAQQAQRILNGMSSYLANTGLATGGNWKVTWIGLTNDRANMTYLATGPDNQIAVCLRGTVPSSLIDFAEDLKVGTMLPFGESGNISQGSMEAFTEVTSAQASDGSTLLDAVSEAVSGSSSTLTIYVAGHSLGGALATTVGVWLSQQTFSPPASASQPTIQVVTFAGPTAGDQSFANAVNALTPAPVLIINQYDAIPQAWESLSNIDNFYPYKPGPGPVATLGVDALVSDLQKLPNGNVYIQPTQQQQQLNSDYSVYDPSYTGSIFQTTIPIFMGQVLFQHAGNTYLSLLSAPQLPANGPVVSGISPTTGATSGATQVTINGSGFSSDSAVDFGTAPATNVTVVSSTQITCTSPAMFGTADVRVTNMFGTSPLVAADLFTTPLAGT
jgi:lipase (class 3)/IPT/TIG domain-containing protein